MNQKPLPYPQVRSELLTRAFDTPFHFEARPVPTPPDLRPEWRVPLTCLLADACWGKRASWHQLHVLNWAVRTPLARATYRRLHDLEAQPDDIVVRYDPSLDRALDLSLGQGLLQRKGGDTLALSDAGKELVQELEKSEVLGEEKDFLEKVRPVKQVFVEKLLARKDA